MNKKIIIIVVVIFLVGIIIGGGTIYLLTTQKQENKEKDDFNSDTSQTTQNINSNTSQTTQNINNNSSTSYTSPTTNRDTSTEKQKKYTHVALQGCVITESNSKTGSVTYKKKCEVCGTVQPGTTSTYLTFGTMNSSFMCSKCKNNQKIQIEATMSEE